MAVSTLNVQTYSGNEDLYRPDFPPRPTPVFARICSLKFKNQGLVSWPRRDHHVQVRIKRVNG